jgi:hypothetical protein
MGGRSGFFISNTLHHYGANQVNYWSIMAEDICRALGRAGEDCRLLQPVMEELGPALDGMLGGKRPPHYIVNFNLRPELNLGQGKDLWRQSLTPVIMLCLDHPMHLAGFILALLADGPPGHRQVGVMEEAHRRFLLASGCAADSVFVMAQAGPPPRAGRKSLAERRGGVVFAGTVMSPGSHADFCDSLGEVRPDIRKRLGEAVDEVVAGEDDVADIVLRHLAEFGATLDQPHFLKAATAIDTRSRQLRRMAMLESLAGLPITVHGIADAAAQRRLPHCRFVGNTDFHQLLDVFSDATVVLNDTINLRESSLIRLFYAMASGCLVATEVNEFINHAFPPGRCVVPLGGDGGRMLADCLADNDRAQGMVDAATLEYSAGHQWDNRLAGLLLAIGRAEGVPA